MNGELKRYPPTWRRLERLREQGAGPADSAVTAAAVILAMTVLAAVCGPALLRWLCAIVSHDLRQVTADADMLPGMLRMRLCQSGLVIIAISATAWGAGMLAQGLQGNFRSRSSNILSLPMSQKGRSGGLQPAQVLPALVGLGVAAAVVGEWLMDLAAAASSADTVALPRLGWFWVRWLIALAGVAALHAVATRLRYMREAAMTRREIVEEQRETEGSWLKARLKSRAQRGVKRS